MDNREFKKQIVNGLCHNLNNPLAIIRGSAEILLTKNEGLQDDVGRIIRQVERMSETIKSLRFYSENVNFELKEPLKDILEKMQQDFPEVKFSLSPQDDTQVSSTLSVALFNLTLNAVEASENKDVFFDSFIKENTLYIRIQNSKPVNVEFLVTPFSTTKSLSKNLGIGYNVAHDIILNLNGNIKVSTDQNTSLDISIPIS